MWQLREKERTVVRGLGVAGSQCREGKCVTEQKGKHLVIRIEVPKPAEARSQIPRWYKGGSRNCWLCPRSRMDS